MEISGPWNEDEVVEYLRSTLIPVRLSVIAPSGYPIVASHWYVWEEGAMRCGMPMESKLAQALRRNPKCAFEVAGDVPPYRGVRGQADAILLDDGDLKNLKALISRYFGDLDSSLAQWLLNRDEAEAMVIMRPQRMMSWDYSDRMSATTSKANP